ncbi:MAG: glycoside hydrolase family 36 protein [Kiritimatiellia bacterium]
MCRAIAVVWGLSVALQSAAAVAVSGKVAGDVEVLGLPEEWRLSATVAAVTDGVERVSLRLSSDCERTPPRFKVALRQPLRDCVGHWRTGAGFAKYVVQDWRGEARWSSCLASQAPVVAFYNSESQNRCTFACSESLRRVEFRTGVSENTGGLVCEAEFFTEPEAPLGEYRVDWLVDVRDVFYAETLRTAFDWCVTELGGDPRQPVAAAAFDPLYSFWYSYHQNVFAEPVERECAAAVRYGMKTIIVDDGWQTDDNRGGYAYCGDWQVSKRRFPDFAAHVAKVQAMGLKYMLWYSVPFVGKHSENFARFKGKYLSHSERLGASTLDPRFPEVRRFLVEVYAKALTEWGLDGLKLDFIDRFQFVGPDPAVAENYAGRDLKSLPLAVDRLMTEIVARCRELRPDVLLEFRQSYVGPAIRRYGNMMRVGDCAYGVAQNRTGSLDLRLSSGLLAVHSDMLAWNLEAPPETAALQLLNVLFSVPQISVRLEELPPAHREMLKYWLDFWTAHRETLMFGELRPLRPDLNYPVVYAFGKGEQIVAVYDAGQTVRLDPARGPAYVVNATGSSRLAVERAGRLEAVTVAPSSVLRLDPVR